jgi:solute carrier family 26 (sodium-independent sulfate anion transporter), member 11
MVDHVKDMTSVTVKAADRSWNDAGRRSGGETEQEHNLNMKKPILHAIVLDFSIV